MWGNASSLSEFPDNQSQPWLCYASGMKPLAKWGAAALLVLAALAAAVLASQRGTQIAVAPVVRTGIVQSVVATGRLNASCLLYTSPSPRD